MSTTLNTHAFNQLIDEDLEWLLKQPRTLERDHIEAVLKEKLRGRRVCPRCGNNRGEMFTADLDWCPSCKHQWPGT